MSRPFSAASWRNAHYRTRVRLHTWNIVPLLDIRTHIVHRLNCYRYCMIRLKICTYVCMYVLMYVCIYLFIYLFTSRVDVTVKLLSQCLTQLAEHDGLFQQLRLHLCNETPWGWRLSIVETCSSYSPVYVDSNKLLVITIYIYIYVYIYMYIYTGCPSLGRSYRTVLWYDDILR